MILKFKNLLKDMYFQASMLGKPKIVPWELKNIGFRFDRPMCRRESMAMDVPGMMIIIPPPMISLLLNRQI